ncbi:hypothetical protein Golax_019203, partial [Gossypium laxum]|nr:hypothetical protein [Gossypium laxum]
YASLDLDEVQGLREIEADSYSFFNGQLHGNRIWTGVVRGIGVTFIQPLYFSSFFNRDGIYDHPDDFERFTYFSRASLDYIAKSGKQPDVLHLHNWETAIVGPLFWDIFAKQCLDEPDKLALCGLDPGRLHRPDRFQDTAKTHLVNILKGGVVYSNKVIVMSSMHSKGRIIHSMSHGLEPTLTMHKEKLLVAPYGFDNSTWDPSTDKFLPVNYSTENMRGKYACKVALQQQAGISAHASSILPCGGEVSHYLYNFKKYHGVGCIISEVSGFDLEKLKAVVRNAIREGAQFVFLGNGSVSTTYRALRSFQEAVEDSNVKFFYNYDEALSHLVFAGSDIILCHSFHDPLLQVPKPQVITTSGKPYLAEDLNDSNSTVYLFDKEMENDTKHLFSAISSRYLSDHDHEITRFSQFMRSTFGVMSLSQALDEMKNNPSTWKTKILNAMKKDFSWDSECYETHVSAYTAVKKSMMLAINEDRHISSVFGMEKLVSSLEIASAVTFY